MTGLANSVGSQACQRGRVEMQVFTWQACGQVLYFENTRCERCGRALGYLPEKSVVSALERHDGAWAALAETVTDYRFCQNQEFGVCNWMIPVTRAESLCAACRHNKVIPDLSVPENL